MATPVTSEPFERHTAENATSTRAWIGVELRQEPSGVTVVYAHPNGPAARAGLAGGYVLLRIDAEPIAEIPDVLAAIDRIGVGGSIGVVAQRQGQERLFRLTLEAQPTRERLLQSIYQGQPAPSISTLRPLQGTVVPSLEQLRGRVVVLEFWASFCTACRALTPELNRWKREGEVLGLRVVGITMDPPDVALDAARHFRIEYAVHFDEDGGVTRAYRGTALPSVFLIDQRGIVRDVVVGADEARVAELHELATRLLTEH